jgi:hypothetical protein
LIPPDELRTPNPSVDPTEFPPPELIEKQLGEIHRGDPLTPKEWREDWHARRYDDDPEADGGGVEEVDVEAVERYAERHPEATAVQVMGALGIAPSKRSAVEAVL